MIKQRWKMENVFSNSDASRRAGTMKIAAWCGAGFQPTRDIEIRARVENPRHIFREVIHYALRHPVTM
jgi:hypothetical protein